MLWLKNSKGQPDSVLTMQVFWTIITAGLVIFFAATRQTDPIVLLSFAAGLTGFQGAAYVVKRGQDAKTTRSTMDALTRPPEPCEEPK